MILNGLSVTASLLKRGEDPLLGQTELATAYQLNKRDLVAAREKTGCYSITRYHLNEAATLLDRKPTDFIYRVSPSLLKADGTNGTDTVSGTEAGALGASGLDPMAKYRSDIDLNVDTDAMLLDLAGAAQGGDFAPEDVSNRFKVLKDIADAQSGSMVAALLSTMGVSKFVRFNAASVNKTIFEALSDSDGVNERTRQAAATVHLMLAVFGAYSTGAALSMLRQFLSTGIRFQYDEHHTFREWLYQSSRAVTGTPVRMRLGNERPSAKLDRVFDASYEGNKVWQASPYFSHSADASSLGMLADFVTVGLQTEWKKFLEEYAEAFGDKARMQGNGLDVDGLVTRTNKLLKSTPQLMSRQA